MTYLLDTNAWIQLFSSSASIPQNVRRTLAAENKLALAGISMIEVCQKASLGKLTFRTSLPKWIAAATPTNWIDVLSISSAIAQRAYTQELIHPKTGKPHKDPADLIISATAHVHGLTVVTSDEVLLAASELRTLSTR
jgi:PIN domain nuclease of toxin-antitoxin system